MGSPDFFGRLGQIGGAVLDHGAAWGDFIGDVVRSPVDIYLSLIHISEPTRPY